MRGFGDENLGHHQRLQHVGRQQSFTDAFPKAPVVNATHVIEQVGQRQAPAAVEAQAFVDEGIVIVRNKEAVRRENGHETKDCRDEGVRSEQCVEAAALEVVVVGMERLR